MLKVNANQRYATDAVTAAHVHAGVRHGQGAVAGVRVPQQPCRAAPPSGPLTATRLGIATVDVGCAQLSMHSARELCGAQDPAFLARALTAFFA